MQTPVRCATAGPKQRLRISGKVRRIAWRNGKYDTENHLLAALILSSR